MQKQNTKMWNKYFIILCVSYLLSSITMSITNTVLPLYVVNGLGMSATKSGILATVFTITCVVCRPFTGAATDKYGRKPILIVSSLLLAVSLFTMGITGSFALILVMKAVQGVGNAFYGTTSSAAAADNLPQERIAEGIGYYGLSSSLSSAIAPSLSLWLMAVGIAAGSSEQNYRLPLICAAAMALVMMSGSAMLNYEKKNGAERSPAKQTEAEKKPVTTVSVGSNDGSSLKNLVLRFIEPSVMPFFLLQLIYSLSSGVGIFIIVYANAMGFKYTGIYYLITAATGFITRIVIGKHFNTKRPELLVIPSFLLAVIAYTALGLTMDFPFAEAIFLASGVLTGIAGGIGSPMLNALALKVAKPERRGVASATYQLGFEIGIGIGSIIAGVIIDGGGYRPLFFTGASCVFAATVFAFFLLRSKTARRAVE